MSDSNGNGSTIDGDGVFTPLQKVLVVDDDVMTARALRTVLAQAGFEPLISHGGTQALSAAREHQPAAAMIDVHLPDVSGLILAQQVRQILGPDAPIIMVSGDTSMETLNSLPHVGANYFFSKPMNPGLLVERLKQCLSPRS